MASVTEFNIGVPVKSIQSLIATRMLIQAGSGGGKSQLIRKMAETFSGHVQQFIFDYEGEFATLREKYPFALVAASGGDIPLAVEYAATLCNKLYPSGMSVIFDLYDLQKDERIEFVEKFLDTMMNMPKDSWHPLLIYIDEAHLFCPQSATAYARHAAGQVIDVATRGRKRDIGLVLATQRISKLHKDASAECLNKMIGRTGQDIDQQRSAEELGMGMKFKKASLRDLSPGQFYCFGPALQEEVVKFITGPVETSHGRKTNTFIPTPIEIKDIVAGMSDLPEEAKRELRTTAQLQERVSWLEHELTVSRMKENREPQGALDVLDNLKKKAQAEWKEETDRAKHINAKWDDMVRRLDNTIREAGAYHQHIKKLEEKLTQAFQSFRAIAHWANKAVEEFEEFETVTEFPEESEFLKDMKASWSEARHQGGPILHYPVGAGKLHWEMPDGKLAPEFKGETGTPTPEQVESIKQNGKETIKSHTPWDAADEMILGGSGAQFSKIEDVKHEVIPEIPIIPADPSEVVKYNKCEKAILSFLQGFDRGFDLWQIAFATDYSENSGSFSQAIGRLKATNLITKTKDGGFEAKRDSFAEINDILGRTMVGGKHLTINSFTGRWNKCEAAILKLIHDHPTRTWGTFDIAVKSGYSENSGSFGQALGRLVRMEMIERKAPGVYEINHNIL